MGLKKIQSPISHHHILKTELLAWHPGWSPRSHIPDPQGDPESIVIITKPWLSAAGKKIGFLMVLCELKSSY